MYRDVGTFELTRLACVERLVRDRVDLTRLGPGGSRMCPIAELLTIVQACWPKTDLAVQVVLLGPSRQIVAHRDPPIPGTRYHVPVIVNAGCWSFHGGTWRQLEVGHVYEMDPTIVHGAVNWGPTTRVHLMVDTW